jgi:uridine kinase
MMQFIGLDGGQGSGKTTYAKELTRQLQSQSSSPVLYVETDDFLIEREKRESLTEDFFKNFPNRRKLWDFERIGRVLRSLQTSAGKTLTVQRLYNRSTGKRDRTKSLKVDYDSIILVGGPYLLEPEMKDIFGRLIFLNVPEATRLQRVIIRNLEEGKSEGRAKTIFRNFEHFYTPYWGNRLNEYDEVIDN